MYNKIFNYIKDNKMINKGDKILVALSGGPDSVCLLKILYELKEKLAIELGAVHINHLLRGEDSDKDEEYVKVLCKELEIPCYVKRADVKKYSIDRKLSSEVAGRQIRYDFFNEMASKYGYNKIATAHNANDQAETVLFRLIRGSGLEGLGGIKKKRDKKIIRPILCLTRDEIESYIHDNSMAARIDKTNFEKIYNRNKIRLDILPYIKENFNEDIIITLNRAAELLQIDNEFIEKEVAKIYNKYCDEKKEFFIINKELFENDKAIITRVVRNALMKYSCQSCDFEMKHIYDVVNLATKETGKFINLPNDIIVENVYGDIYIKNNKKMISSQENIEIKIKDIDGANVNFGGYAIKFSIIDNLENNTDFNYEDGIRYFNFDKIKDTVNLRYRENGDKIIPFGMKGSKKLKDIFIDIKMPKEKRDMVPILCFDDNIAWILGVKFSEEYKVLNKNKNILKVIARKEDK